MGVGHVSVPCNLHALWMLRNTGVGVGWGMLAFHVTCMRCGCYATRGLGWGWGMLTLHVACMPCGCYATQGLG